MDLACDPFRLRGSALTIVFTGASVVVVVVTGDCHVLSLSASRFPQKMRFHPPSRWRPFTTGKPPFAFPKPHPSRLRRVNHAVIRHRRGAVKRSSHTARTRHFTTERERQGDGYHKLWNRSRELKKSVKLEKKRLYSRAFMPTPSLMQQMENNKTITVGRRSRVAHRPYAHYTHAHRHTRVFQQYSPPHRSSGGLNRRRTEGGGTRSRRGCS
ncbi:hypothetical protein LX36DRAFT_408480 [Colletotrichum falcatum]|nr:hypothetical protein LX36DRAFT_408480 [Colletotrichum falcatum]